MLAGAATGAVFPCAAKALLDLGSKARSAASLTQFADHGGAALAAIIAAVIFVPILGLIGAAILLFTLQALALAVTCIAKRADRLKN
jgi:predicted membrane-bound spermidine synthase